MAGEMVGRIVASEALKQDRSSSAGLEHSVKALTTIFNEAPNGLSAKDALKRFSALAGYVGEWLFRAEKGALPPPTVPMDPGIQSASRHSSPVRLPSPAHPRNWTARRRALPLSFFGYDCLESFCAAHMPDVAVRVSPRPSAARRCSLVKHHACAEANGRVSLHLVTGPLGGRRRSCASDDSRPLG